MIEKEELNKILDEKAIKSILKGQPSWKLAAELKKIHDIQKLIMGDVSQLGSTLIISIKVVDTMNAKIEGGRIVKCPKFELEDIPEMWSPSR